MKYFFAVLLVGGLIAFTVYQTISIVRDIKARKKAKSDKKGDE